MYSTVDAERFDWGEKKMFCEDFCCDIQDRHPRCCKRRDLKSISSHRVGPAINVESCNVGVNEQTFSIWSGFWLNASSQAGWKIAGLNCPSKTMEQSDISGWDAIRSDLRPYLSGYLLGFEKICKKRFLIGPNLKLRDATGQSNLFSMRKVPA